ncbi:helix-turn-helix domain-containing protein [Adlercreutzia sp. R7]|uniref:Helix-turn-helix domain-containing protein n=1 Tax=Adlercreutzia wanghongyangiae TaxID=3111451 RepID=A0ABU6IFU0_9ACTN|nr:helix-turn-helix domain-containing protein [Adlercreutzia sp. R7]
MELKEQLKEHRARLGLSQEEVAERIFVSRQTISNWETDRTYPDVQSLLLLSELFGTSIDELVKGDVEAMEKAIENDWKTMSRLAVAAWALVGVGLVMLLVAFAVPTGASSLVPNFTESEVLGMALFLVLWILGCILLGIVDHMKKQHDLVTYRDIVAYSRGEEPARDSAAFSRRHPPALSALKLAVCAASGAVVGIVLFRIFS